MKIINLQTWRYLIRCQENYYSDGMKNLLIDIDEAISLATFLKKGKSSTVVKLRVDQHELVVKRANMRHTYHAFRRLFQPSRAKKNWDYAQRLKRANILTFEPIAMLEKRWGPFRRESYFITNYISGSDLMECFVNQPRTLSERQAIASGVVKLVKMLAKEGLYHRDLNLSNIIMLNERPYLIDLDSMQRYKKSFLTEFLLTLKLWHRFMENVADTVGRQSPILAIFQNAYKREKKQ